MSSAIVNTINVDYPLTRSTQIPETTSVVSIAGARYPRSRNAIEVIWDFGDGTVVTVPQNDSLYRSAVLHLLSAAPTFFPIWELYLSRCIAVTIPKFEYIHTYGSPGVYEVKATIIHNDGTAYVGTPEIVTVDSVPRLPNIPENWTNIASQYSTTTDLEKIYADRQSSYPKLSSNVESISALPINTTFLLTGVVGRVDVDYIKWDYGDGAYSVTGVYKGIVTNDMCIKNYTYQLAPTLNYVPTVTVYASDGSNKFKFTVTGNSPNWSVRSEVSTSVALTPSTLGNDYAFTMTPRASEILPVETIITHNVRPNLKYIIWDYDDGTFETIPVRYNNNGKPLQTVTTKHTYYSINVNPILPSCLFLYHDPATNKVTSEIYRARNYLDYQRGVVNPRFDSRIAKIESDTNFSKRNNISVQVLYPPTNTGQASAVIRLCFLFPKDALRYEKIIWEINGQSFVQDKNTAENFSYFKIKNIVTPSLNLNIKAQLFGIPAIVDGQGGLDLVFSGQWSYTLDINDKTRQERINETNKRIRNYVPALSSFTFVPPPTSFSTEIGDEVIITPVLEIESEENFISDAVPIYLNTDIVFDKLFTAYNPAANFLNRDQPSTASTFTGELGSKRSVGFFKPSKTSTIIVDPGVFTFTLNLDKVSFNTLYYFPDPFIYGSDTNVLTFSVAENSFKRGILFSSASNEPNLGQDSISYYGYNSRAHLGAYEDMSYIYDEGYVHDFKTDVYGNKFGLVKNNNNFKQEISTEKENTITNITFNGYKFYDDIFGEGLNFNYASVGTDNCETIRTGLTAFTNGFNYNSTFYHINFKTFNTKFKVLDCPIEISSIYKTPRKVGYRDGGVFMLDDATFLADPISSDEDSYPSNNTFYYTDLYEGGVHTVTGLVRPTDSQPASFDENARPNGVNSVLNVDCGLFVTDYPSESNIIYSQQDFTYVTEVDPGNVTLYDNISLSGNDGYISRANLEGVIFVKTDKGVHKLSEALPYLEYKYPNNIFNEISNKVLGFDLTHDTYFIQTSGALVIDKLRYQEGEFVTPRTPNYIINYNNNLYNKITNRFKVDNSVYFSVLSASSNIIVPFVYRFDINAHKLLQVFPTATKDMEDVQELYFETDDYRFYEVSTPHITYMREGNIFNLSFLMKDSNKLPMLFSINFAETNNFTINSISKYRFNSSSSNIGFTSALAQDHLFINLSSNEPTFVEGNKYYIL